MDNLLKFQTISKAAVAEVKAKEFVEKHYTFLPNVAGIGDALNVCAKPERYVLTLEYQDEQTGKKMKKEIDNPYLFKKYDVGDKVNVYLISKCIRNRAIKSFIKIA